MTCTDRVSGTRRLTEAFGGNVAGDKVQTHMGPWE
jgi:hypothetical protein